MRLNYEPVINVIYFAYDKPTVFQIWRKAQEHFLRFDETTHFKLKFNNEINKYQPSVFTQTITTHMYSTRMDVISSLFPVTSGWFVVQCR